MKKSIFLSVLALAAVVSCQKSEIVDTKFNEEIGFETYTGRDAMTKAAVVNEDNLGDIKVYGYYTGNTTWNSSTVANLWEGGLTLLKAEKYQPQGTDVRYWANPEDNYTFLAYAIDNKITAPTSTQNPKLSYTVDQNIQNQIDVLYAEKVTGTTTQLNDTDGVNLVMKHALSRITVKATAKNAATAPFKFDVKEISLTGTFNKVGTLELATGKWAVTSDGTETYVFHQNGVEKTVEGNKVIEYTSYVANNALTSVDYSAYSYYASTDASATATEIKNNYLMIIPTAVAADATPSNATLNVKYTTYYAGQESKLISKDIVLPNNFAQGKAYSLVLEFDKELATIKFNVTVDDWKDINGTANEETSVIATTNNNPEKWN